MRAYLYKVLKIVQMASGAFSATLASKFEKERNIVPFSL